MRTAWTRLAMDDLEVCLEYHPVGPRRSHVLNQIVQKVALLAGLPEIGPAEPRLTATFPDVNSRYVLAGAYKIIYHIMADTVYID